MVDAGLTDTHCHLDDPCFDADRDLCLSRAVEAGVIRGVIPGVSRPQWARARALAARYGWKYAVGTHPMSLPEHADVPGQGAPDEIEGAVAIGECGLDGTVPVDMEVQERVLSAHLALAREAGLPVILHGYRAHDRLLPLLRRWAPLRGVLHSYSGGPELVDDYVALGLHLSMGGPITWEKARKPVLTLQKIPKDRLLAETDAPDQCPRPWRGRNEPAFLVVIVEAMERLRGEPLRDVLEQNARSLGW